MKLHTTDNRMKVALKSILAAAALGITASASNAQVLPRLGGPMFIQDLSNGYAGSYGGAYAGPYNGFNSGYTGAYNASGAYNLPTNIAFNGTGFTNTQNRNVVAGSNQLINDPLTGFEQPRVIVDPFTGRTLTATSSSGVNNGTGVSNDTANFAAQLRAFNAQAGFGTGTTATTGSTVNSGVTANNSVSASQGAQGPFNLNAFGGANMTYRPAQFSAPRLGYGGYGGYAGGVIGPLVGPNNGIQYPNYSTFSNFANGLNTGVIGPLVGPSNGIQYPNGVGYAGANAGVIGPLVGPSNGTQYPNAVGYTGATGGVIGPLVGPSNGVQFPNAVRGGTAMRR